MVEAPNRRAPVRIASIWRPGLLAKATRPAAGVRGMLAVELGERTKRWFHNGWSLRAQISAQAK
jgi:hypothetical protein